MPSLTTREILENQFNGLTPIKRQNPRYGEKNYYYINPNRDKYSSLSDEDIAYVDSPDVPNPFLQQSSTTNPLSSSSSNKMGTDTTGLTDTSSFGNTSSLTDTNSDSSFFAQLNNDVNDLEQTKTLKYYSTNLKDYDLINRMLPIELKHENIYSYPYYDSVWKETAGFGTNVSKKDDFHEIDWRTKNGSLATYAQEEECLGNLEQRKKEIQASSNNINKNNYLARSFKDVCDIRMPRSEIERKYVERMGHSINELRTLFPNFNQMHPDRQNALMDMNYNLGLPKFKKYKKCMNGINSNNADIIEQECQRGGVSQDRNDWTINSLIKY